MKVTIPSVPERRSSTSLSTRRAILPEGDYCRPGHLPRLFAVSENYWRRLEEITGEKVSKLMVLPGSSRGVRVIIISKFRAALDTISK